MKINRVLISFTLQLALPCQLVAQAASTAPHPTVFHTAHTPINLNLSSTAKSTSASKLAGSNQVVNIKVGGQTLQVTAKTLLTPAESLAVFQMVSTGQQSIALGALGNAVGGSFNIGNAFSQHVSSLVIPKGVTAIDSVTSSAGLHLTGDLTNAGSLYAVSSNPTVTRAVISALDIYNQSGAILSTVLPPGGISGITGAVSHMSLSLSAINNIVNAGTIRSAGNLSLTAGGTISNVVPAGIVAAPPVIQAQNNINLTSGAGNIVNAGLISALGSNISVAALTVNQTINLNNTTGTIYAANAINFRDASYKGHGDLNITGGDFNSVELNLNSGTGTINTNVGNISGIVNASACNAHIGAATPDLKLGALNISDDPTYYNTAGDVNLVSAISTNGSALAILASGNINISAAAINTKGTSNGGNILMVAGANITSPSPQNQQVNSNTFTTVTIAAGAGSNTGGKITIDNASPIATNGAAGKSGGNVQLIAYSGTNTASGTITTGSAISTGGNGAGANGSVTMIAGATSTTLPGGGTAIQTSSINTTGSTGSTATGAVSLSTATPTISGGNIMVLGGTASGGTFTLGTFQPGGITTTGTGITTNGAGVQLAAGGNISLGANIQNTGKLNGSNVSVLAGGNITLSGSVINTEGSARGGNVLMVAGANLSSVAGKVTISNGAGSGGGSATGGSISTDSLSQIETKGTSSGSGGNVQLIAYSGSSSGSGSITTGAPITTGGNGAGANGSITMIAGATSGNAINTSAINTTGSTSSTATGAIALNTAAPTISGTPITVTNGTASGGSFTFPSASLQASNITTAGTISANGVAIQLAAGGNITIGANIQNTGGSSLINLQATAGTLNVQGGLAGAISSSPTTGTGTSANGGTITINAQTIAVNGTAGPLQVNANGLGSGKGGTVNINQFGVGGLNIGTQNSDNNIQISAASGKSGGNGGTVTVSSGGDLLVDLNGITANPHINGQGEQLTLVAGAAGNLQIGNATPGSGNLAANGVGTGAGGKISLGSNSSTPFVIGGTSGNYINGTLTTNGASSGAGGSIIVTNTGSGGVTVTNAGSLISQSTKSGNGGSIDLEAPAGALTVNAGTLSAPGVGANSAGGKITINAQSIVFGGAGPLQVDANGAGKGNGGTVDIHQLGAAALNIGSVANDIQVSAVSGTSGGSGGVVSVSSGGDLIVDIAAVSANPSAIGNGQGAQLAFAAGAGGGPGNLQIGSALTVNGVGSGAGGSLSLTSNSVTTFVFDGSTGNSVNGALVANGGKTGAGGSISVTNNGTGGVTLNDPSQLSVNPNPTSGNGGSINLEAPTGILTILLSGSTGTLSANPTGKGTGGTITLGGNTLALPSSGLTISAGGTVALTATTASVTNINATSISAANVALIAPNAGFTLSGGTVTGTNSVALVTGVDIVAGSLLGISAGTPTLILAAVGPGSNVGTVGGSLSISAANVTAEANGSVWLSDTIAGNSNLVSSVVQGTTYTNSAGVGGTFLFSASGITSAANAVVTAPTVILDATGTNSNIGANSGSRILVNSPNVTAQATGSVFITDSSTGDASLNVNLVNSSFNGTNFSNSAGNTFSFIGSGVASGKSLTTLSGANITGNNIDLTSSGGFSLSGNVGSAVGTNSVALISHDSITSVATVSSPTLILATTGAGSNIGTNATTGRLAISAQNVTAQTASGGSVFITDSSPGDTNGNVNLINSTVNSTNFSNSAGSTFSFGASGIASGKSITTQASVKISAANVDLTSSGTLSLAGGVAGTNSVAFITNDSITSLTKLGSVSTPTLALAATGVGSSIGSSSSPLKINIVNVTAQANTLNGSVFITDSSKGATNGTVNLVNATVNGVSLTNSAGATFSFGVTGLVGISKSLSTAPGVNITGGVVDLTSSAVILLSGSVTAATGDVNIKSLASATSAITSTNGSINITTSGALNIDGLVTASKNVNLTTTNNGSITINRNVTAGTSGTGSVNASANGTGSITTPNQVIANPSVGRYAYDAAATPDGTHVYVPNNTDNTVSVIDTATNTVISTISLSTIGTSGPSTSATSPKGAVASPDGSSIYVVCDSTIIVPGDTAPQGVILVISTATQQVTSTINIKSGSGTPAASVGNFDPELIAVSSNGATKGMIYVFSGFKQVTTPLAPNTSLANNQVTVIDPSNPAEANQTNILLPGAYSVNNGLLGGIAVNPQGTLAYVGNSASNNISVINLATNTVSKTISLSTQSIANSSPVSLAFDPTGAVLYVGISNQTFNSSTGQVIAINTRPTSPTFNQPLSTVGRVFSGGYLPQALTTNAVGTQLFANPTYVGDGAPNFTNELAVVLNPLTLGIVEIPNVGTNKAPDGYGSNTFSTVVTNAGVPNTQTYIADPTHTGGVGSVSVIQTPTIQGHGVILKSGGGTILANYDAEGGTFTANTTGSGSVVVGNVGSAASTLGASSAGSGGGTIFEFGSLGSLNITGPVSASLVSIETTANNGNISIGASIGRVGASSVSLFANGTGTIIQTLSTASLKGNSISLGSILGDIGASSAPIQIGSGTVSASTGGGIFVNGIGSLSVGGSSAGTSMNLSSSGNIAVLAGSNLSAPTINLNSTNGSIGSSTAPVNTTTSNLSAVASGSGSVFLNNTGVLNLDASSAGGTFSLVNTGNITIAGVLTRAATITLQTASTNNGSIGIGANVGSSAAAGFAGSAITINSAGQITASGGILQGRQVLLEDKTSGAFANPDIGSIGNAILSSASSITISSAGNAFISDPSSNAVSIGASSVGTAASHNEFQLFSAGQITISGAIKATNVDVETNAGSNKNIVVGASLGLTGSGSTTLTAGGTGNISQTAAGVILSSSVILNSSGGNIGTSTAPIKTSQSLVSGASSATFFGGTSGSGSIFLSNTSHNGGSLVLDNVSSGSVLQVTNAGNIVINTGTTLQASGSISLTTTGTNDSITQMDSSGTTIAPTVTLKTSSGGIGSVAIPLQIQTQTVSANAGGSTSGVVLNNTGSGSGLTINQSSSGSAFSVTDSTGSLTVAKSITTSSNTAANIAEASNSLSLVEAGATNGAININANLSVFGGTMLIQSQNTSTGIISFGNAAQVKTLVSANSAAGNGDITVAVGSVPGSPTNPVTGSFDGGSVIATATAPGQVFLGASPSAILGPVSGTATLKAQGRNIILNSPSGTNTISFGTGVSLVADPPGAGTLAHQASLSQGFASASFSTPSGAAASGSAATTATLKEGAGSTVQSTYYNNVLQKNLATTNASLADLASPSRASLLNQGVSNSISGTGNNFDPARLFIFGANGLRPAASALESIPLSTDSNSQLKTVSAAERASANAPLSGFVSKQLRPSEASHLSMQTGGVLFAPDRALSIQTPFGQVAITANAIALVVTTADGVAVYNMHDNQIGDVSILHGDTKYPVLLGRHIMIAREQAQSYEELNPLSFIAHADMHAHNLPGGGQLFHSKFSVISAVAGLKPVMAMRNSDNPQDRKLAYRLIKNAAILTQTQQPSAPYRRLSNERHLLSSAN